MAAEIRDITESNQDLHSEMHECLRILLRIEAVLVRFQPLLDQMSASPVATGRAVRRARRS